jgi:hypothetical protein
MFTMGVRASTRCLKGCFFVIATTVTDIFFRLFRGKDVPLNPILSPIHVDGGAG